MFEAVCDCLPGRYVLNCYWRLLLYTCLRLFVIVYLVDMFWTATDVCYCTHVWGCLCVFPRYACRLSSAVRRPSWTRSGRATPTSSRQGASRSGICVCRYCRPTWDTTCANLSFSSLRPWQIHRGSHLHTLYRMIHSHLGNLPDCVQPKLKGNNKKKKTHKNTLVHQCIYSQSVTKFKKNAI